VSIFGVGSTSAAFISEGFLALSLIEADRADRMVEQRLQLCFVREPGRFHIVVPFVRGCVYGRWKSDGPQSTPQGLAHRSSRFDELTRIAHLNPKTDLRFCDLSSVNFGNSDLREADLTGVDLRCADFRQAKIEGAIFADADLDGARWPTSDKKGSGRALKSWMTRAPDPLSHEHYLAEIRRFPLLAPPEEHMLARRFREHGDLEAASKLYTSHLKNVVTESRRWLVDGLSIAEVFAAGNLGLYDAIRAFEPDRGVRLARTAKPHIQRSVVTHVLNHLPLVTEAIGKEAGRALRRKLLATRRRSELRM
jgi:Pentapeptide repeats (8 copies)/Sigma-70 factor, region 1.2